MMVWKCPPLHLPNWNNLWKWKQEMNATELADVQAFKTEELTMWERNHTAAMLRKLQYQNDKYRHVLESIANEHVELSHDKIKWQCEDHIKWAKDVLK
jgi:hypothetical protein